MLVYKGGERQGRESREEHQWRVKEDQTRLRDQTVFCEEVSKSAEVS